MNANRPTPRHIIIIVAKVKERVLKEAREKQRVNYKGTPINTAGQREWQNIFRVLKGKSAN